MANETLSVKVTSDIEQFNKGMDKVVDKIDEVEKATKKFSSKNLTDGLETLGKGIEHVGDGLTKYITKPALAAATAVGGITLAKGWSRMTTIDTARAKLVALSNAAEKAGKSAYDLNAITNDALAAVEDTAYGLDEAMTAAASAVASGVKPGKDLVRYLTLIGDGAAIAGTSFNDMAAIFNKVQNKGKVTTREIYQVANAGIDIYGALAQTLKISREEVSDWVTAGKVGAEDFYKAMEYAVGGSAKLIGSSTISGALKNIGAAVSRIGYNIFTAGNIDAKDTIYGQLLPLLLDFKASLKDIEEWAKTVGQTLGQSFGLIVDLFKGDYEKFGKDLGAASESARALVNRLQPLINATMKLRDMWNGMSTSAKKAFTIISVSAGPALVIIGKMLQKGSKLISAFSVGGKFAWITELAGGGAQLLKFVGIFGAVVALFAVAYTQSESFRNAINGLVSVLGGALMDIFKAIAPILETIISIVTQIITVVADAVAPIIEALTPIIELIMSFLGPAIQWIADIVKKVADIVGKYIEEARKIVETAIEKVITAIEWLKDIPSKIDEWMKDVYDKLTAPFKKAAQDIEKSVKDIESKVPGLSSETVLLNVWATAGQNANGTNNWRGGLTWVNERGGELMNLPNGTQIIPHDISVQYAKEAARNSVSQNDESLVDGFRDAILNLAPYLQAGMIEAVDGMGIEINGREFGRVVEGVRR